MGYSRRIDDKPSATRPLRIAAALRRQMAIERFAAGDVLVRQGEQVRTLYVVTSGTVRVLLGNGDDARVVATLGRGAWIGEMALLTRSTSSTTVVAETDIQVLTIGHRAFVETAEADPSIYREIARELAERLHSADDLIEGPRTARIVGLQFDPHHADHADNVIQAIERWAHGPHIVIAMDSVECKSVTVGEFVQQGNIRRLRAQLTVERSITVTQAAPAREIATFLRMSRRSRPSSSSPAHVPPIDPHGPSSVIALGSAAVHENHASVHRYGVGAGFDHHRVARTICQRRVGLALGGGGARGFAHIGVLRALAEANMPIDVVTGTSVGAAVAAGVAAGRTPSQTGDAIERTGRWATIPNPLPLHGVFTPTFISQELRREYGDMRFEDLATPLAVIAVDVYSGEEVVLSSGELVPALLASMAVPGIFPPVRHDGRVLVDGAVRSPVPIATARALGADIVIASRMRVTADPYSPALRRGMPWLPETMSWSLELMQDQVAAASMKDADVVIDTCIDRDSAGIFDFGHRAQIESAGESAAHSALATQTAHLPALRQAA